MVRKSAYEVIGDVKSEMEVSIVLTSRKEFHKEKIPLFTAVKKEEYFSTGSGLKAQSLASRREI